LRIFLGLHKFNSLKKILIIRFSSIGDIVLTSPVVRCLRQRFPEAEIHYCTKKQYVVVLEANPYINKIICIGQSLQSLARELREQRYDFVVDLHKSLRSVILRRMLARPSAAFPKLNFEKWLLVNLKINRLSGRHIVDRYFEAVKPLGVSNDGEGLDYFIPEKDTYDASWLPESHRGGFVGFVTGGRHATKIFPPQKILEVCEKLKLPIVLLGGKEDFEKVEFVEKALPEKVINACGKFSLHQSAALVKRAELIITNDTGLMHFSAAFRKKIIVLWGNTVPEFGMYPYLSDRFKNNVVFFENKNLSCRPCSKIGYPRCPKVHFDCMNTLDAGAIAAAAHQLLQ
jgi:ADP-heptose:LPS heptosyltransferase